MKLNAWLRQDHAFPERLQVVERLAQALNEIHDRGESLAALDPERIDVSSDGYCDVSGARRGTSSPAYCAPERAEGGPASPEADIYAAGAIAWEVLSGRPCGSSPTHLAEASPSVPRELADAVMACLEQSPQWRPRDLTYLAQLAQHAQGQRPKNERGTRAATAPGRASARSAAASANMPLRSTLRRESRSHLPLAIAAGLVVVAAAGSYYWFTRTRTESPNRPITPSSTAITVAARPLASPTPAGTAATPAPRTGATTSPTPVAATPTPFAASTPEPAATPLARATPTPAPVQVPAGTLPPVRVATAEIPPPRTLALPPVTTLPVTTTTTSPAAPLAQEPVVLLTLSPLTARRPGKQIFDLRGSGLRPDLRVRVLAVKEVPRGITVLKQVWKGPNLFQVLIDLEATAATGNYALVLEEAAGGITKPLVFTVTK